MQITERQYTINGLTLWVAQTGKGSAPPLLLLHGLFDRWEVWNPILPVLADHYHVFAPDLRGHARSAKPASHYAISDYVADIVELLMATHAAPAFVLGHSLGGLLALRLAVEHSDLVNRIVLEDPPLGGTNDGTRLWLESLLEAKRAGFAAAVQLFAELDPERDPSDCQRAARWLIETADGPFLALLDPAPDDRDPLSWLDRLTTPTLLLCADPDAGGVLDAETIAAAQTRAPHLQVVTFSGLGHSIHTEAPHRFLEAVMPFLMPER